MSKIITIVGAAALAAFTTASVASAQSSPFDPCMVEARAYCLALHSNDRLAYSICVQEEYEACANGVTAKPVAGDKIHLRRCGG